MFRCKVAVSFREGTSPSNSSFCCYFTLRIMGSQNWWFGDPGPLPYTSNSVILNHLALATPRPEAVNAAYMDRCDLSAHGFYATPGISFLVSEGKRGRLAGMSQEVRINGLFHLLINGIYWGYNLLILTFDPSFLKHPIGTLFVAHVFFVFFWNEATPNWYGKWLGWAPKKNLPTSAAEGIFCLKLVDFVGGKVFF